MAFLAKARRLPARERKWLAEAQATGRYYYFVYLYNIFNITKWFRLRKSPSHVRFKDGEQPE